MAARQREEVLNPVLAEVIVTRGLHAIPEAIRRRDSHRPDVLISLRGLRCVIESNITDVGNAKAIVQNDATGRIDSGLTPYCVHGENC
jgi:hypothetical protein